MSEILKTHYFKRGFSPQIKSPLTPLASSNSFNSGKPATLYPGYISWHDASDQNSITAPFAQDGTSTVSGIQGTNSISVLGSSIANKIYPNGQFKAGSDLYTVASVNSNVITTVEPLSITYGGQAFNLPFCTQINDKSGNGYNLTEPAAAIQPVLNINQKNGLSALGFFSGARLILPAGLLSAISSTPCTVFWVGQSTGGTNRQSLVQAKPTSGTGRFGLEINGTGGSNTASFSCGSPQTTEPSTGTITPNNTNIYIGSRSGTAQTVQVNNGTPASNTNAVNLTYTAGFVGTNANAASTFYTGLFEEMVIYNTLLGNDAIAQNLKYFNKKWSAY